MKICILLLPLLLCVVQGSAEKLEPELPFEGDLLADVSEQATPSTAAPNKTLTPTKLPTAKKTGSPSKKTLAPTVKANSWTCVANRECKPKDGKTGSTGSLAKVESKDEKRWTKQANTLAKCKAWGKSKGGLLIVKRDKKCTVYKAKCPYGERKVPSSSDGTMLCTFTPASAAKKKSAPAKALEVK